MGGGRQHWPEGFLHLLCFFLLFFFFFFDTLLAFF